MSMNGIRKKEYMLPDGQCPFFSGIKRVKVSTNQIGKILDDFLKLLFKARYKI